MTENTWTVRFEFPCNPMYPNRVNGYQSVLNKHVLAWPDRASAERFAQANAGKYGYDIVQVTENEQ